MKNKLLILILAMTFFGCGKKDGVNKMAPPSWTIDTSGKYPATMTAVVKLTPALMKTESAADKLAAFIGEECRGIGQQVHLDSTSVFFVLIKGKASENDKIRFKYYRSYNSKLYETAPFLDFVMDANYGTAANPEILELVQ